MSSKPPVCPQSGSAAYTGRPNARPATMLHCDFRSAAHWSPRRRRLPTPSVAAGFALLVARDVPVLADFAESIVEKPISLACALPPLHDPRSTCGGRSPRLRPPTNGSGSTSCKRDECHPLRRCGQGCGSGEAVRLDRGGCGLGFGRTRARANRGRLRSIFGPTTRRLRWPSSNTPQRPARQSRGSTG